MFKFKLQVLLDYRKSIEERLSLEFSDKLRQLEGEKDILKGLKRKRSALIDQLTRMQDDRMSVAEISLYYSSLNYIKNMQNSQEDAVGKMAKELEEKREELLDVVKKRKAIEILREKKLAEYRSDIMSKEGKELDEAGITAQVFKNRLKVKKQWTVNSEQWTVDSIF